MPRICASTVFGHARISLLGSRKRSSFISAEAVNGALSDSPAIHARSSSQPLRRYNRNGRWVVAAPESPALMALCMAKVNGLSKVRLVNAEFIWTEPHSRRLKVSLTVQKEVGARGCCTALEAVSMFIPDFSATPGLEQCQATARVCRGVHSAQPAV